MSTSTDGEISFGIMFEEGFEFPWDIEVDDGENSHDFGGDIEEWWRLMNGFSIVDSPFDQDGNYKPGYSDGDQRIRTYFDRQNAWDAANPRPVQLVNYQHCDCPAYILAIPQSVVTANRGCPVAIKIDELKPNESSKQILLDFCERFGIESEGEPQWWLSSYWG